MKCQYQAWQACKSFGRIILRQKRACPPQVAISLPPMAVTRLNLDQEDPKMATLHGCGPVGGWGGSGKLHHHPMDPGQHSFLGCAHVGRCWAHVAEYDRIFLKSTSENNVRQPLLFCFLRCVRRATLPGFGVLKSDEAHRRLSHRVFSGNQQFFSLPGVRTMYITSRKMCLPCTTLYWIVLRGRVAALYGNHNWRFFIQRES